MGARNGSSQRGSDQCHGDPVVLVAVYPAVLGTYGDGGNIMVLASRLRDRGRAVRVVTVEPFAPIPASGDLYVLGGAEDAAQIAAARALRRDQALQRAVDGGATVFAVCAGFQILGTAFPAGTTMHEGLGLLDAVSAPLPRRAVGELVGDPAGAARLPLLTGYENHASGTTRGSGVAPLSRVQVGVGNGDGTEGARHGRIVATYMHGPALARNPALADHVLEQVTGPLPTLTDPLVHRLRRERLTAAFAGADRPRSALGELVEHLRRHRGAGP